MNPHKNSPGDPLTDRQASILEFIASCVRDNGYPPTIREIGVAFGIRSTNGVHDHLTQLMRKGRLTHAPGRSRAWRVEAVSGERTRRRRQMKPLGLTRRMKDGER